MSQFTRHTETVQIVQSITSQIDSTQGLSIANVSTSSWFEPYATTISSPASANCQLIDSSVQSSERVPQPSTLHKAAAEQPHTADDLKDAMDINEPSKKHMHVSSTSIPWVVRSNQVLQCQE